MAQTETPILIITSALDATSTYVCDRLATRGIPFVRFNTEDFPGSAKLHWQIHPTSSATITTGSGTVEMSKINSVWYRRPARPRIADGITEPAAVEFTRRESEAALAALWQDHKGLWVNHPAGIQAASRKPEQLQTASDLGFRVPDTILSSDSLQVRRFYEAHGGEVIFKPMHQEGLEIGGKNFFAYASRLTAAQLRESERLELSPTLFQAHIVPQREIRVTMIGQRVFAAAIDTRQSSKEPDWRRIPPDRQRWEPHELPSSVEALCRRCVAHHGLLFGAIDLILTSDGDYYFLELNPNGQWVWIEMITGMAMSTALIDVLSSARHAQSTSL